VAALALPVALIVGRIAGILTGSETGTATNLPWSIIYTHPDSRAYQNFQFSSTHPAVAYEMLLTAAIFGAVWFMKDRVRPDGMLFAVFMGLYSINRFFVGFVRFNKAWLSGMGIAQLIALVILIVLVPLVSYRIQLMRHGEEARPARNLRRS
jgi:phosphatidylglycerol:prolipoprotein diacylglycerol transferase